jgi:hypothetical protein
MDTLVQPEEGPYPDVYFQTIIAGSSQKDLDVVRPVGHGVLRHRFQPLYIVPTTPSYVQNSMLGAGNRKSLSVAAGWLRGPNMHPQNVEYFHRHLRHGMNMTLPPGVLLFSILPEKHVESILHDDSGYFLDPVAAIHSVRNMSTDGVDFWDANRTLAHPTHVRTYLNRHLLVTLVVHRMPIPSIIRPVGAPFRPFSAGISRVQLVEPCLGSPVLEWEKIIDLGFMSTEIAPYGSFSDVDYCRMIVYDYTEKNII